MTKRRRKRVPLTAIEKAIADLVKMGLVADSGLRRNGQIVWEVTPQGRIFYEKMLNDPLVETLLVEGAGGAH